LPSVIHRVLAPPAPLRAVVAYAWEHSGEWLAPDDILLPDVGIDIALRICGEATVRLGGAWEPFPRRVVVGSLSRAIRFRHWGWTHTVGIRLAPGSATLLGAPAAALRSIVCGLEEIAPALDRRLATFSMRLAAGDASAEDLWASLLPLPAARTDIVVDTMAGRLARRSEPIGRLAQELGLSRRQLDRRFASIVGWSPTDFRRVGRLSRAVSAASTMASSWAGVAQSAGYYDQAHLIRDFRDLTGETPTSVFPQDWYANFS
jgi:AraC-like DNA-binding protein